MAALGARAAVRDAVGAYVALVRVTRMRAGLETCAQELVRMLLSPAERVLFSRAVTMKRRAEFLAGRLAAKIVCLTIRNEAGLSLDAIDVRPEATGAPLCVWPDGTTQHVSIAHGGAYAVAMTTVDGAACGIDVEPASRQLDVGLDGLFHPLERPRIACAADARRCWTVREAWGKLTTAGVASGFDELTTMRVADAWWLALRSPNAGAAVVAAGENAGLAMAFAIRDDGRAEGHYISQWSDERWAKS